MRPWLLKPRQPGQSRWRPSPAWMPQQQGQPHCCPARYRDSRVSPTVALFMVVLGAIVARMDHVDLAVIIGTHKALTSSNFGSLQVGVFKNFSAQLFEVKTAAFSS